MYTFYETKGHKITAYARNKAIGIWRSETTKLTIKRSLMRIKLICLTCLIAFLQVSFAANAQKISLVKKNASITDVLRALREQSGYDFMINQNQINIANPVSLNVTNKALIEVLDQCFKNQPITYFIENNMIIVASKKKVAQAEDAVFIDLKGKIVDEKSLPLIGASIKVKGSTQATVADVNGNFLLKNIEPNAVLVISFIGYTTQEVSVGGKSSIDIKLMPDASSLNEVVVTALGLKRSEKSLSYAAQTVNGDEVTRVKTDNMMNSLNGKVAGLNISSNASGVGGSVKVIMRGNKSAAGSNQPLYVIDGVPLVNSSNANGQPNVAAGIGGAVPDGGDGISNLNPDDIESISVLRGASASALYGSQAANGVILITTKKGKAGTTQINYSSSATTSKAVYLPEFQNDYGQTPTGAITQSWGPKITNATDNLPLFFKNGNNYTNSLNLSAGSEIAQSYFSYSNTNASGIQEGNSMKRHNLNFRETAKLLKGKLNVDGSANYISQKIDNSPVTISALNALPGLYMFPRGLDIKQYKDNFELPDASRNGLKVQNWPFSEAQQQNPWWVVNRNNNYSKRNRIILNASAKYDINSWFGLQIRGNLDRNTDDYNQRSYAGTNTALVVSPNGQFEANNQTVQQIYGDLLATFTLPSKSDFKLGGVAGVSIKDQQTDGFGFGPGLGLFIPNVFLLQNVVLQNASQQTLPPSSSATSVAFPAVSSNGYTLAPRRNQMQSVFASADLSYKDYLFLTLTGRNDWSSSLSFTPNGSYFYPSAGLSVLVSQMLTMPDFINYTKIRGSFAQVGNSVATYATNPQNYLGAGGAVISNGVAPLPLLKPEKTNSYEFGADFKLLDNKLSFNITYYKTNTFNQFFQITPSVTTGFTKGYVNAGDIQNSGIEALLGFNAIKGKSLNWTTSINFSTNKNIIKDVNSKDGIDQFLLTVPSQNYESVITKGGSYGDIYGYKLATDNQGRVIIGSSGLPSLANNPTYGQFFYNGNPNPKFLLGWNNSFDYKKVSLSFLVDGRFGGEIFSSTQAFLDRYGVSKASGDARNAGGVAINGVDGSGNPVSKIDADKWYSVASQSVSEYIYSATVVRLREVSLGYQIPVKSGFVKKANLSLIGRNLLYFYKKAPSDSEITISSANGLSGLDSFNPPALRSLGISLNLTL
ncbi:SusC/RagA family TonB-linked outer membrane protein [Pedobacter arcticus]|uniref:SusC/RagA family TonB-linked outer membrane protein n=1 Tax=Pedobacter arcticus TaxID=752140 RepID=UPI0002FDD60E|nr:SusC/RagA family TonB-linked outer membrane protein [Pedobacter arcticus]